MKIKLFLLIIALLSLQQVRGQTRQAYFIDGYHGGVWGHYPDLYTSFIVDQLRQNPGWKINLEIEPETWDKVKINDPVAYAAMLSYFKDQSAKTERLEYVNPAYGQSYMNNILGESIIRQFYYGIKKVHSHFPKAVFTTYSSEEPCFTSALPQILTSFGFKYASLKNPNTCWGGYSRAHGGELVNWTGSDGSKIITVPRYGIESLQKGSTWQTIAWFNSPAYINAALADGIKNPVGMTLQDAGWKNGPFLGRGGKGLYQPTTYTTWHNYFENAVSDDQAPEWKFNQEDVLVSLMWGSQVLQKIAQQVRVSENKIVSAEKIAAINKIYEYAHWPGMELDSAWRTLMLSQHHDCWIVPYNGQKGDTWADKVVGWTGFTNRKCDSIINLVAEEGKYIRVYNPSGNSRSEVVAIHLPAAWLGRAVVVADMQGKAVPSQIEGQSQLIFKATVPAMGYNSFMLQAGKPETKSIPHVDVKNGKYDVETDLYHMVVNPAKGGLIESLVGKTLNNKEFVDQQNERGFNELRGNFYKDGGFKSSKDNPATVSILEQGALQIVLQVKGTIDHHPFTQLITITQGQRTIGIDLRIDWQGNAAIGQDPASADPSKTNFKAFYNDRYKLLATFPLNLKAQKVYKDAPFDVMQSKLTDTFFDTWDDIKNNEILNWVDVTDGNDAYGMALLTDHTTSYTHGADFPLGLDIQYSGPGLWWRDYAISGPTTVRYALIPHTGKWDKSAIWTASVEWNQPLIARAINKKPSVSEHSKSFIHIKNPGIEVSSMMFDGNDILIRLFNAEGNDQPNRVDADYQPASAQLVELNGTKRADLHIFKNTNGYSSVQVAIPRFGFRTIKLSK